MKQSGNTVGSTQLCRREKYVLYTSASVPIRLHPPYSALLCIATAVALITSCMLQWSFLTHLCPSRICYIILAQETLLKEYRTRHKAVAHK